MKGYHTVRRDMQGHRLTDCKIHGENVIYNQCETHPNSEQNCYVCHLGEEHCQ